MNPLSLKTVTALIVNFLLINGLLAQNSDVETLIPGSEVSGKIGKSTMGIGAYVNVSLTADLIDYNSCITPSNTTKGIDLMLAWYNTNDETGNFMLSTFKSLNGFEQDMESFKNQSGFEADKATEEAIEGGKLWIITSSTPCINEITGPTGVTSYFTHLRCYVFNGTTTIKLELQAHSKPEKLKAIMNDIIDRVKKFDFSKISNTVPEQ